MSRVREISARLYNGVRAQRTGVLCALTSAALLGVGSFVMDRFPEHYRGLGMDDLRFFLERPSWVHAWLYGLAAALTLWALSALLCTWEELRARIRRGVRRPSAYGAPLLHVTFVLALVAHLQGGLGAYSRQHVITPEGVEIGDAVYRVADLEEDFYPTGMPKRVVATVERTVAGETERHALEYNVPIVDDAGARELILGRYGAFWTAELRYRGQTLRVREGAHALVGREAVFVQQIHRSPSLRVPVADVLVMGGDQGDAGSARRRLPLAPQDQASDMAFVGLHRTAMVGVTERVNPSIPLVLVVSMLVALGVLLVAWERVRRGR